MNWREDAKRLREEDPTRSWRVIAEMVGKHLRTVERWLAREQVTADGPRLTLHGTSVLKKIDAETGIVSDVMWWEKKSLSKADIAAQVEAFVSGLSDSVRGHAEPVPAPEWVDEDHCNIVPYGDPHVGLYAWAQEAGADFDLKIAEQCMVGGAIELLNRAPPAAEGWLINLGDFFHADSQTNSTPASGHALDVDSRWPKIQQAGARIMRRIIAEMLKRHTRVIVKCVRGNHDPHAGYTLAMILAAFYESEPRVHVCLEPGAFWYRSWGSTLVGVCHGHTVKKLDDLPSIMAVDRPTEWGAARHRRWFVGHFHNSSTKELRGCSVEIFRTLAPADAWTHASGYRSDRSLDMLTIHRTKGERGRARVFFEQAREVEA